jgi:hypothetical protein
MLSVIGYRGMYIKPGFPNSWDANEIPDSQTYGKTIHKLAVFDPIEVPIFISDG